LKKELKAVSNKIFAELSDQLLFFAKLKLGGVKQHSAEIQFMLPYSKHFSFEFSW